MGLCWKRGVTGIALSYPYAYPLPSSNPMPLYCPLRLTPSRTVAALQHRQGSVCAAVSHAPYLSRIPCPPPPNPAKTFPPCRPLRLTPSRIGAAAPPRPCLPFSPASSGRCQELRCRTAWRSSTRSCASCRWTPTPTTSAASATASRWTSSESCTI